MLPVLPIEVLTDYLHHTISTTIKQDKDRNERSQILTVSIYNIILGSYMDESDILTPNPKYKRNHEYPQFVKNIFKNLESQISPEMLEYISHYENINIKQHLILIDNMYQTKHNYHGLHYEFPNITKDGHYILEYDIQHNEYKNTHIVSSIEPVIIPSLVDIIQLRDIIKKLTDYVARIPVLINIMDCTSRTLTELFVNNDNPYIYISKPDCLLCDTNIEYMPMITFDITNQIRWVNYNLDKTSIPDLLIVKDVCPKSNAVYNFLINLYKVYVVNIAFVAIYKMLGILSITRTYTLQSGKIITFFDITFNTLIKLWHQEPDFPDMLINNFDLYFEPNIKHYVYSLVHNKTILARVQNNTYLYLKDILLEEAKIIIEKLNEYFPENPIVLKDSLQITVRDTIKEYMHSNGTGF
jgi:hypothetical protein